MPTIHSIASGSSALPFAPAGAVPRPTTTSRSRFVSVAGSRSGGCISMYSVLSWVMALREDGGRPAMS